MTNVVMQEAERLATIDTTCFDYETQAGLNASASLYPKALATHYHRLMTEGWRPEPKVDPAMNKRALSIFERN